MKKCPYCGKEYADEVTNCPFDDRILVASENNPAPRVPPPLPTAGPPVQSAALPMPPEERRLLWAEIFIVCLIAFGPSLLASTVDFAYGSNTRSGSSGWSWVSHGLRQVSVLALLWYVLRRRGRTFLDLGWGLRGRDLAWAAVLVFAGGFAYRYISDIINHAFYTTPRGDHPAGVIGHMLFGDEVPIPAIFFQFINPFFEELVVRAYLMTEIRRLTNNTALAIIVSTALQTSYHFYQGVPSALGHCGTFLIFSIFYAKTNRIGPVILAHMYFDVSATWWYLNRTGY